MFGFGFKSKVKSVLNDNFNYPVTGFQKPTLSAICNNAKHNGVNEYDAAIMFMMVQMNMLEGNSTDVISFIKKHTNNIKSVQSLAASPESDVSQMLSEIHTKHGI